MDLLAAQGVSLLAVTRRTASRSRGHDFRPAYLNLRYARKRMGNPPVAAFTATATESVIRGILDVLGANRAMVVNTGTERENLELFVEHAVNLEAKRSSLKRVLSVEDGRAFHHHDSRDASLQFGDRVSSGRTPEKETAEFSAGM